MENSENYNSNPTTANYIELRENEIAILDPTKLNYLRRITESKLPPQALTSKPVTEIEQINKVIQRPKPVVAKPSLCEEVMREYGLTKDKVKIFNVLNNINSQYADNNPQSNSESTNQAA